MSPVNKIFVRDGFQVKRDFQELASNVFSEAVENIDFKNNTQAAESINNWVEDKTEGRITNIVNRDHLNNNTSVVLINTLYLKANFVPPFDQTLTRRSNFYKTRAETVEVDTMYNRLAQIFLFAESLLLDAKFLKLPLEGNGASLIIILPNKKNGLENLEKDINYALTVDPSVYYRLEVALPKFKIKSNIDMKKILKNLGVNSLFNDLEADLSGIAGEKGDLFISEAIQKSFIEVNENGVGEFAAPYTATIQPISWSIQGQEFIADHPFIFHIKVQEATVYVGRVVDPSA